MPNWPWMIIEIAFLGWTSIMLYLMIQSRRSRECLSKLVYLSAKIDKIRLPFIKKGLCTDFIRICKLIEQDKFATALRELRTLESMLDFVLPLDALADSLNFGVFSGFPRQTEFLAQHYRTLGLSVGATEAEVISAYRALAKRYHPDTSAKGDPAMFTRITEAYDAIRAAKTPRA